MPHLRDTLQALALSPTLHAPLDRFAALFLRWNRSINLSAARTHAEVLEHIVDSLHIVPHLTGAARILDVGAGGGLPSVIAAICLPDSHITALEPVHKKHAFLRTAARELALPNLEPLAIRLDDHAPADYDAATSRATFDLRDWLLAGVARVRPAGIALGFEAVPRGDLPAGTQRHPYRLADKARAIVSLERP
ncbi:MAG TPA: 16S rRNA (guanine(527)-N(7))-methyltransferase RsmG [Kofleriaceae bacterium]|nr:16S rRNA (guanine(527)-N(7))-methyltransferase RsmG [Kofleriaceae bacterium]